MFDYSVHWLVTALDASIKAGLIALMAAATLWLLRVRDSNLRHRVWTGVLVGMLALPALAQVMPALRLPFAIDLGWIVTRWEREQTAAIAAAEATAPVPDDEAAASLVNSDPAPSIVDQFWDPSNVPMVDRPQHSVTAIDFGPDGFEGGAPRFGLAPGGHFGPEADWSTADGAPVESPSLPTEINATADIPAVLPAAVEVAAPPVTGWERFVARWPLWLFLVWSIGTALLALRLLLALISGRWLLSRSTPIEAIELNDLGLAPQLLSVQGEPLPILECDRLRVPITLGWYHPRILLPLDWVEWPADKLAAVLTHERTHVDRRDCAVMFLAELNRCVAWFHPLAWWLKRHLSALAEAACDDAVIGTIGDRATYARHLLEVASVASRHRGRVLTTGVSMARRSNVEYRIHSILDAGRPLTQRLTRATALLLVVVIVPVIALAAALQPAGEDLPSRETIANVEDQEPAAEEPAPETQPLVALADEAAANREGEAQLNAIPPKSTEVAAESDPITVRGIVTDTDLKPIEGATIWFTLADGRRDEFQELGRSGPDGRFELTLPDETATWLRPVGPHSVFILTAQAEGYAVDRMPLWAFGLTGLKNPHGL